MCIYHVVDMSVLFPAVKTKNFSHKVAENFRHDIYT